MASHSNGQPRTSRSGRRARLQPFVVGKRNVVEDAAARKCVRQGLLGVACHDNDRPIVRLRADLRIAQFRNAKIEPLDLVEDVVREIPRRLVDLVDEHNRPAAPATLEIGGHYPCGYLRGIGKHDGKSQVH